LRLTEPGAIAWWTLKVCVASGKRAGKPLGLTVEFRQVLRDAKRGRFNPCYIIEDDCSFASEHGKDRALRVQRSGVWHAIDWTWFPDHEISPEPWRPPKELRALLRARNVAPGAKNKAR
jgi:hypothetical protein